MSKQINQVEILYIINIFIEDKMKAQAFTLEDVTKWQLPPTPETYPKEDKVIQYQRSKFPQKAKKIIDKCNKKNLQGIQKAMNFIQKSFSSDTKILSNLIQKFGKVVPVFAVISVILQLHIESIKQFATSQIAKQLFNLMYQDIQNDYEFVIVKLSEETQNSIQVVGDKCLQVFINVKNKKFEELIKKIIFRIYLKALHCAKVYDESFSNCQKYAYYYRKKYKQGQQALSNLIYNIVGLRVSLMKSPQNDSTFQYSLYCQAPYGYAAKWYKKQIFNDMLGYFVADYFTCYCDSQSKGQKYFEKYRQSVIQSWQKSLLSYGEQDENRENRENCEIM